MSDDNAHFEVRWADLRREPKNPPDPRYPEGIDVDAAGPGALSCLVQLPYPAARCGVYQLDCRFCLGSFACTTAGRPDDPRSMRVPCQFDKTHGRYV